MVVIFAEKPDIGTRIAAALDAITLSDGTRVTFTQLDAYKSRIEAQRRSDGLFRITYNGAECVVTWGFGHLCTLKQAKDYNEEYASWFKMPLPFIPHRYEIKRAEGRNEAADNNIVKQLSLIKQLFNSAELIINATDLDREGEVIFSYVYEYVGCRTPFMRACFSSLTPDGILAGFTKDLRDAASTYALASAGRSRAIADWLVGGNLTAALTIKRGGKGTILSIGRVQTPVLNMVVEREKAIQNFVKKKYFVLAAQFTAGGGTFAAAGEERYDDRAAADAALAAVTGRPGTVTDIESKTETRRVPNLYSLSSLQLDASNKYGFSLQETLDIAQSLYEKGYTTYPRTNSQFLTDDMRPKVIEVLKSISRVPMYFELFKLGGRTVSGHIFNSAKVESHFAIIPTGVIPQNLTDREAKIYDLICRSLIKTVFPPAKIEKTAIKINVDGHVFGANGIKMLSPGWMVCEAAVKENVLPQLKKGDVLAGAYKVDEKETTPPKRYTDATLLSAMLNAGREIEDDELRQKMADLEIKGIGTEATRAGIIETLLQREYIERKGKSFAATEKGISVIEAFPVSEIKSAVLTAMWEERLDNIAKGREDMAAFINDITEKLKIWTGEVQKLEGGFSGSGSSGLTCPHCGKPVREYKTNWGCTGYKDGCKFYVSKTLCGRSITAAMVKSLCQKGSTPAIDGFVSKAGNKFKAKLVVDQATGSAQFSFDGVGPSKSKGSKKGAGRPAV